jgi:hypothetical protein
MIKSCSSTVCRVSELTSIVCICNAGQGFLIRSMFMGEPDKKFFNMVKPDNVGH